MNDEVTRDRAWRGLYVTYLDAWDLTFDVFPLTEEGLLPPEIRLKRAFDALTELTAAVAR